MDWQALLLGAIGGAASGLVVPLLRDTIVWEVERRRWARQTLHDALSRIAILADDAETDFTDQFSMAGQGASHSVTEVMKLVRSLHNDSHKLALYLPRNEAAALHSYLQQAREAFDEASSTWGQWHDEDSGEETVHNVTTLKAQGAAAQTALTAIRPDTWKLLPWRR